VFLLQGLWAGDPPDDDTETVHEKHRDHACGFCKGVAFGRASDLKAHTSAVHVAIMRSRGAK